MNSLLCSINNHEFKLFRDYIEEKSGIVIPPEKAYLLETRLSKLMLDAGTESFSDFYKYVTSHNEPDMSRKIIDAITVNETMWFRDASLWKTLEDTILPGLVGGLSTGKKLRVRIWCAAVSTGQEAYSVAMCIDNYLKKNYVSDVSLTDFSIFATDISSRVIDVAKRGKYDKITITRGLSDYYRERYFQNSGSVWEIDNRIKNAVRFERYNLQDSYTDFGLFDIIFCRYVFIYFPNELKKEIVNKMNTSLTDNGILFTGSYVLYDFIKDVFDMKHYDNCTYYSKKRVME